MPALWDAVNSLARGALITEEEADDYVAGLLPPGRLAIVEALLEKTPAFRDELRALREEFAGAPLVRSRPVTAQTNIALGAVLEPKPESTHAAGDANQWMHRLAAKSVSLLDRVMLLFQPPATVDASGKLARDETLLGPPDVVDAQGKRYQVQVSVRETKQGDFLIGAEAEPELGGKTLRIGGAAGVVLPLKVEREKAFAMVSLSEEAFLAFCQQTFGTPEYVWE